MNERSLREPAGETSSLLEEALATLAQLADVGAALRIDTRRMGFEPARDDDRGGLGSFAESPEQRLRLAETRYRVLIEQIPVVTFLASLEGDENQIYVSPQIEALLGFTQEEWVSDPVLWYEQVHPDDRDRLSRDFAAMCVTGDPFRGVVRVFTRNQDLRWVHMEARFVCDEHGQPLFLQGAGFDVTDQFKAQETREHLLQEQAAREEAERERRRLLEVFSALPAAIAALRGPEFTVEFANPVARGIAASPEIIGQPWSIAFPQFGKEVIAALSAVRQTGTPTFLPEHPFTSEDGPGERYFNFVCLPLPDARSGDALLLTHMTEVTREVRARRDVEQALQLRDEALAQLELTMKTREQFLSAAAHDLKTPIATSKGWAQLLKRRIASEKTDTGWLTEGISAIESGTTRMSVMVEELLDLARLQTGVQLVLEQRPTDLVALVREAVADDQEQTERHRIVVDAPDDALVVRCDPVRIRRVVSNLLNNAIKYSPDGGAISVRVGRAPDSPEYASIEVQDQGLGIPAADLPQIFDQFHRGSNVVGRIAGTGIGLNAARHVVELHGGTLTVVSEEGAGSTFTIRLRIGSPSWLR